MISDARRIFERAGVPVEGNEKLFEKCAAFLSELMAIQSATMGLTKTRVRQYQEQMDVFVEDLKEMKAKGEVKCA